MKVLKSSLVALAVTATALSFQPEPAAARSTPASAGQSVNAGDRGCFQMVAASGMQNLCTYTARFELPTSVDVGGNYAPEISTGGPSMNCFSIAVSQNGTTFTTSPNVFATGIFTLPTVFVPTKGTLSVGCDVVPNARVNNVNY
jgi:hypothetical protein